MRYDLVARFYRKAEDTKPVYSCPLDIYSETLEGDLEGRGFIVDEDGTPGYLDYIKRNVSMEELQQLTRKGYVSEVMDVLYAGESEGGYERIEISAMEIEAIDDEGTIPPFGIFLGNTFVEFLFTEPESPVLFTEGDPYEATENTRTFEVPLQHLKNHFGVLTLYEVRERLKEEFGKVDYLSFEELEGKLRAPGIINAKE